ncbi:MAG: UDP-N-acetylmuramate dehydrogenase, partial [Bifidobacteriaceae bacterium]|nr:UDP-N-acetylmuramate dehydrogenase [Bifidobacteriaceae bacterium]
MVCFADLTTLRVGGPIRQLVEPATAPELIAAVRAVDAEHHRLVLLGGGANTVAPDNGADMVIRSVSSELPTAQTDSPGQLLVTAQAGLAWADLVAWALAEGLSGLESLAGIPGTVGAAPIQNIGAYGHEVAEIIESVLVWDRSANCRRRLNRADLGFGYRTSLLKNCSQSLVVLQVVFRLAVSKMSLPVAYRELAELLEVPLGQPAATWQVVQAVLELRRRKGMVVDPTDHDTWSAGSFFTNPILSPEQASQLPAAAPRFPMAHTNLLKTAAAWLISNSGITPGWGLNSLATTSTKHVLALTNRGGAQASDIM